MLSTVVFSFAEHYHEICNDGVFLLQVSGNDLVGGISLLGFLACLDCFLGDCVGLTHVL